MGASQGLSVVGVELKCGRRGEGKGRKRAWGEREGGGVPSPSGVCSFFFFSPRYLKRVKGKDGSDLFLGHKSQRDQYDAG